MMTRFGLGVLADVVPTFAPRFARANATA